MLRAYLLAIGRAGPQQRAVLSIGWAGFSLIEGLALFDAEGEPSEHLKTMRAQLELIEIEVLRTRELGRVLIEKASWPSTRSGWHSWAMPISLALHRGGAMGLIYAHLVSMGNLRKLVQWRVEGAAQSSSQSKA